MRSTGNSSSSSLRRAARAVHRAVFQASRQGRAAEIATWANAASSFAVAAGVAVAMWSELAMPLAHAAWIGLGAGVVAFVGLRLSLAHRFTVWIAATFGTLTIAALGGSLAWLFAHVIDSPAAPSIAAVLGAVVAALGPAWSYAQLARRRAEDVRDSLFESLSAPPSC